MSRRANHSESPCEEPIGYDVFLSHSSSDAPAVTSIAARLRDEEKLRPFLAEWDLVPGDPWIPGLEKALANSTAVAVFLGPGGKGAWHDQEAQLALVLAAQQQGKRVIPVLLPGARLEDLNGFLSVRTCVEFEAANGLTRLVAGITGQAPSHHGGSELGPNPARRLEKRSPPEPGTKGELASTGAADGGQLGADHLSTRFFIVGAVAFTVALALGIWSFGIGELTNDQRQILRWLFSIASGFAAGAFVGGVTVRTRSVVTGVVATGTGGFAVWLLTFSVLFVPPVHGQPPPPPRLYDLLVHFQGVDNRPRSIRGQFVVAVGSEEYSCVLRDDSSCRIPSIPNVEIGREMNARLDSSTHQLAAGGSNTFEADGNVTVVVTPAATPPVALEGRILLGGTVPPPEGTLLVRGCEGGEIDLALLPDGVFSLPSLRCQTPVDSSTLLSVEIRLPLGTYFHKVRPGHPDVIELPRFASKATGMTLAGLPMTKVWPPPSPGAVVDFGDRLWFPIPEQAEQRGLEIPRALPAAPPREVSWDVVDTALCLNSPAKSAEVFLLSQYGDNIPGYRQHVLDRLLSRAESLANNGTCEGYDTAAAVLDEIALRRITNRRASRMRDSIQTARRVHDCRR